MTPSSRPTGKRLPISCQACRTRKIRCSRDGRPCQTCVRRGLGAEDCIYLGQPRLSSENTLTTDTTVQNELLARIRNLEDLLHKQVGSHPGSHSPLPSPSLSGSFSEPDSAIGLASEYTRNSLLSSVGTLQTFASGYVRYLPLAPQWSSTNHTSSPSDPLDISSEIPDDDDDLCIPFAASTASREELLAILPPSRYCDALKDVYFRVFSPVSHLNSRPPSLTNSISYSISFMTLRSKPSTSSSAMIQIVFRRHGSLYCLPFSPLPLQLFTMTILCSPTWAERRPSVVMSKSSPLATGPLLCDAWRQTE
jgi:hypothetical protein